MGEVIDGRYRLDEQLGSGGMSEVWRALDVVLDREVAVKLLPGTSAVTPSARAGVRAEAQAAARLWHPHVTNVYDYGESTVDGEPVPYVVMELLPGRTLAARLADGPLPPRVALRVVAEVAAALAAAHAQNLVHRDVKPSNVMLTPSGAKMLDFGIAAVVGSAEVDGDGLLRGTPAYLAPERLTAGQVSAASDVYALGLLIHRVLTNRLPWQAETTTAMLDAHVYVEPEPLPPVEDVPDVVRELCARCLAKEPADRPSAAEAAATLAAAAGIVPPPSDDGPAVVAWGAIPDGTTSNVAPGAPPPSSPPPRSARRRRTLLATGAATLAAVVAVAAMLAADGDPDGGAAAPGATPSAGATTAGWMPTPGASGGSTPSVVPGGGAASPGGPRPSGSGVDGPVAGLPSSGAPGPGAPGPTEPAGPPTGPAPSSPAPEATRTTAPPPGAAVPIVTLGGIVTVRCRGDQAEVVGLEPEPGYEVKDYEPGPADQIQVVLESPLAAVKVKATCSGGLPVPQIKIS